MNMNIIVLVLSVGLAATLCQALTLPLIHRDAFHNNHTETETYSRIQSFHTTLPLIHRDSDDIEPNMRETLKKDSGEYLVELSIGTPPCKTFANVDTGSSLTWTQCEPCKACYPQNMPKFNPITSSTFKFVPYSSLECYSYDFNITKGIHGRCNYSIEYEDKSTSKGFIAKETLELGSLNIPEFKMGCGVKNQGLYSPHGSGIIGLGNTPDSLIGQLGQSIDWKFGYCLSRHNVDSKSGYLSFGEDGIFTESVRTPLISKQGDSSYYVTMNAITIGNIRVPLTRYPNEKGNVIVDSGTPLLYLPPKLFDSVKAQIDKQVKAERVGKVKGLELCYQAKSFKAPKIVVNFEGAKVKLNYFNMFQVSKDVVCFASRPTDSNSDFAVYGSVAQRDFLVGYDLGKQLISFKPADCSAYTTQ